MKVKQTEQTGGQGSYLVHHAVVDDGGLVEDLHGDSGARVRVIDGDGLGRALDKNVVVLRQIQQRSKANGSTIWASE